MMNDNTYGWIMFLSGVLSGMLVGFILVMLFSL